ncbi:MAG: type II toxin-antitoxin system VapB family antitoxin [Chloroflexota bacterium]
MRTTLVLDDRLVREAKRRAADTGSTLSDVVNDALREALRPAPEATVPPFRMITYGDPDEVFQLTPEAIKEMELQDDIDRLR